MHIDQSRLVWLVATSLCGFWLSLASISFLYEKPVFQISSVHSETLSLLICVTGMQLGYVLDRASDSILRKRQIVVSAQLLWMPVLLAHASAVIVMWLSPHMLFPNFSYLHAVGLFAFDVFMVTTGVALFVGIYFIMVKEEQ